MRIQSLNHLLEIVHAVAKPQKVLVLGSCSLLHHHPKLGDSTQPLELTADADFLLEPVDEAIAESLHIAAGLDSAFHSKFGYYLDILRPNIVETLPAGWESRLLPVTSHIKTFALDPYDLALVKLVNGRAKDLALLRELCKIHILDSQQLRDHYQNVPLNESEAAKAGLNLMSVLARPEN